MEKIFVVIGQYQHCYEATPSSVDGLFTEEQAKEYYAILTEVAREFNDDSGNGSWAGYEIVELSAETGIRSLEEARKNLAERKQRKEEEERYVPPVQPKNLGTLADFFPKT